MTALRIIGDVHGQIDQDSLFTRDARPYFEILSEACSVQIGDMGNGETYDKLIASVDAARHRFFPGNHEKYDRLPPHNLGDSGSVCLGGVEFFFVRGAASGDREKLIRIGREEGTTLWFEQEELTEKQMLAAEDCYLSKRPAIMLSHEAPTDIARLAWKHARQFGAPNPRMVFNPSRTSEFLQRLLERHAPRIWLFGHHHRDWRRRVGETLFVCLGELSYVDIDAEGNLAGA